MDFTGSSIGNVIILSLFLIIPIFIIWILTFLGQSKNCPPNKKTRNFCYCLLAVGALILMFTLNNYRENKDSRNDITSPVSADGFTIESFKVRLNVHSNNVVDVEENVTVNFYESGHHGIYRFIPTWLEYTGQDGNTISRNVKIKELQAIGDEYETDSINGKQRIKIGSADYTLPIGLKNYTITYQYNMGEDPFTNFDEFIFHAYGDFWGTKINNASLEVTMPTTISSDSIKFFADKYRTNDITSYVDYHISDNTIYAQLKNYDLYKSLTIDIGLPEGYFSEAQNNYGHNSLTLLVLIIVFGIITFINWLLYGKDYQYSETVEFYAPENYDSAEIGYIYKKESGRKLAISLIVSIASKGIIRIDEVKDKKTIVITNLCSVDVSKAINRKIGITKLKDAKGGTVKSKLDQYFHDNNTAIITEKFDDFYSSTKSMIKNGYLKIDYDTINDYSEEDLKKVTDEVKNRANNNLSKLSQNERMVYDQLFVKGDENNLTDDKNFYIVFNKLTENLQSKLDKKIDDSNSFTYMAISSILFFVGTVYFMFAFSIFEDLNPRYNILYLISILILIISVIFIFLMTRKSTYGSQITAKIKGFKKYLETAEKPQLEGLVNQNPNYFYEILPYAYVLGVSKKWIEKFENIPMPPVDMGSFDYYNTDSFNDLSNSVSTPVPTGGSSSSSCGGGCSSCGGGCSSCGGGGSW